MEAPAPPQPAAAPSPTPVTNTASVEPAAAPSAPPAPVPPSTPEPTPAPAPAPAPKRATGKAPSKTFSIPKFDALKQEINKPKEETTSKEEELDQPIGAGREKAFDLDALKAAWKGYMDKMEAAGNHQESIILKEQYELNGSDITLHIANEALVPGFEKVKADLLKDLRNTLENDKVTLRSKVVQVDQSKMLYTDQEKFEHLKKKYPALKDLQEKLGLDPEF